MTGPGFLEYRCRRCGAVQRSTHTPSIMLSLAEITTHGRALSFPGVPAHVVDLHTCADGQLGVTDVIGGVLDPKESL